MEDTEAWRIYVEQCAELGVDPRDGKAIQLACDDRRREKQAESVAENHEDRVVAEMRSAFTRGVFYRHPKGMSDMRALVCWSRALKEVRDAG